MKTKVYKASAPQLALAGESFMRRWAVEARRRSLLPLVERVAIATEVGRSDREDGTKFQASAFGGKGHEFEAYRAAFHAL